MYQFEKFEDKYESYPSIYKHHQFSLNLGFHF